MTEMTERLLLMAVLIPLLAGCGFHLRGTDADLAAGNLYLEGPDSEVIAGDFAVAVKSAGGNKANSMAKARGVIHVYQLFRQTRSLTLGRYGRTNEYDLIFRLAYDVRNAKGEVIGPRQEIELHRDYYNDQSLPLSKDEEENMIRADMLKEIAQTLVRRTVYALSNAERDRKS
jgi:LPS-assembly lipoprotein